MQRYDTYKDSGVKWLGKIPSHWEVKRLASYFTERRVKVSDKEYEPLSVTKLGVFPQWENVAKTNDGDNRKLVKKGDFVINSRSDRKGSSGVADRDGSVSLINIVLKPRNTIRADFSNYLLKSYKFIEEYYRNGRGIVADLWTTRYDEMKMIKLAVPPLEEQTAIANYLDTATAKIDAAIAQQQKMIDLLNERKQIIINRAVTKGLNPNAKMKDSGVEWIGEVPEGWEMRKLKHLGSIKSGDGIKNEELLEYGKYPVWGGNGLMGYTDKYNKDKNAIVIGRVGALCGNVRYLSSPTFVTDNALIFDITEKINHLFLLYTMQAANLNSLNSSNAQPLITGTKVKNVVIPFPDIEEQTRITIFKKKQCENIDEAIVNYQQQISLLQERKQIIINEVVTGKVKVSN